MEINNLTHKVIGCAYRVHNVLGPGFLEKVYENALKYELDKLDIEVLQQGKLPVWYEGQSVGVFFPDLWIDKQLIIEIKAVQSLILEHEMQLVHYLTATKIDNGLLINFGPSVQVKRKFRDYKPKHPLISAEVR
jgi:GxxExxY protein